MTSTIGPSNDRGPGFTLLELIVVMMVICTALAMVAPNLRGFWRGGQVRDAALQMLALTRYARSQAATECRIYALRFQIAGEETTYRLQALEGLAYAPVYSDFGRVFTLPPNCRVEVIVTPGGEANCFRFFPTGRTDGLRLHLTGPDGDDLEIVARSPTEEYVLVDDEEAASR